MREMKRNNINKQDMTFLVTFPVKLYRPSPLQWSRPWGWVAKNDTGLYGKLGAHLLSIHRCTKKPTCWEHVHYVDKARAPAVMQYPLNRSTPVLINHRFLAVYPRHYFIELTQEILIIPSQKRLMSIK